ncbi:MAG: FHA domain-containing protein [Planctomycetota bacterium]
MKSLINRLKRVRAAIPGCESLTVASSDGFILASTHEEQRKGEFLAAVTSVLLHSINKGFEPYEAGTLRALDFRGERQLLLLRLQKVKAFLILLLKPGAHPINLDDAVLREVTITAPRALKGLDAEPPWTFYLARDEGCWIPVRRRGTLIGRDRSCDVVINDGALDRRHAIVEIHGNTVHLRDLDSQAGTRLNGRRLRGSIELHPGDRFTLPNQGGYTLICVDGQGQVLGAEAAGIASSSAESRSSAAAKKKTAKKKTAKKKTAKKKSTKKKTAKKKTAKKKTAKEDRKEEDR